MTSTPSHDRLTVWDLLNEEIPRDHFPQTGLPPRVAKAIVSAESWTDANPVMNLSSFVTTFTEPEAEQIAHENILKNYVDHDMYPQLFAMEQRMVKWLHEALERTEGRRGVRRRDSRQQRGVHAGGTRAQVELA